MTIVEKKVKLKLGCYYPLLMSDIKESFYGVNMVSNLLTFNLFERSMQYFSHQTKGFFLYEGQGWEYGLVSAWKNFGNGQITGVSHTPLKYWDLRSFFDPRSYVKNKKNLVNFPDFLAVNGEFYKSLMIEGCFPSDRVVELEALRYGYLENFSNTKCCNKKLRSNRLLVVTDYMWDNTKYQLEVLEKALLNTDHILEIIIKPHPNCPIPKNYNLSFDYQVLSDPIEKLLQSAQVVFSSNATSASVDAYSTGKKIIVMLDPNGLNLSPLNGVKDVFFIGSPGELSLAFDSYFDMENNDIINNREKFFIIDNELPRWKKVLIL
jgi:surface carbohydrate biosynthesis protein (TIGR04326 family)